LAEEPEEAMRLVLAAPSYLLVMNGGDEADASGEDRSRLPSGPPHIPIEVISQPPWQRRYPVVLDTSVLIADALRRSGTTFTALTFLAQHDFVSIVAPRHVEEEVLRKLPKAATDTRRDPAQVLATLQSVHLPLIHFIDLPADLPADSGVMQVARRDRTDAPLAHLTTLLSPCLVLSTDKDLMDSGTATTAGWPTSCCLVNSPNSTAWSGAAACSRT
jgi:predicted nucleic acid-binding protein